MLLLLLKMGMAVVEGKGPCASLLLMVVMMGQQQATMRRRRGGSPSHPPPYPPPPSLLVQLLSLLVPILQPRAMRARKGLRRCVVLGCGQRIHPSIHPFIISAHTRTRESLQEAPVPQHGQQPGGRDDSGRIVL